MQLGDLIKSRRLELGMTQKELAQGICTQALISRIENNDTIPKKDILDQFEERLELMHTELNIFYNLKSNQHKIDELIKEIRDAINRRDYKSIELLIIYNKEIIASSKDINDIAFFNWMNASICHQLHKKSDQALEILNKIPLEDLKDELSIEIVNATGLIYYQKKEFKPALASFYTGMQKINDQVDFKLQAKLLFNYTLTLEESNKDKDALDTLLSGIELLLENDSLFLLGDFYYTKAFIFNKLNNHAEAISNLELAKTIFKIQNNSRFYDLSTFAISEIKKELVKMEE